MKLPKELDHLRVININGIQVDSLPTPELQRKTTLGGICPTWPIHVQFAAYEYYYAKLYALLQPYLDANNNLNKVALNKATASEKAEIKKRKDRFIQIKAVFENSVNKIAELYLPGWENNIFELNIWEVMKIQEAFGECGEKKRKKRTWIMGNEKPHDAATMVLPPNAKRQKVAGSEDVIVILDED